MNIIENRKDEENMIQITRRKKCKKSWKRRWFKFVFFFPFEKFERKMTIKKKKPTEIEQGVFGKIFLDLFHFMRDDSIFICIKVGYNRWLYNNFITN